MALLIQSGKALKANTGKLTIKFPVPFQQTPNVIISHYWEKADAGVGCVDTIDTIYLDSFTVISQNAATNYYVNWIAIQE
jgi:hypothetical protein